MKFAISIWPSSFLSFSRSSIPTCEVDFSDSPSGQFSGFVYLFLKKYKYFISKIEHKY